MVSDIHGDFKSLEKVLKNESFDRLVVLGDLFSYGKIILDSNNNEIIKLLKKYKDKLILIRGNCDYFIDYEKIGLYEEPPLKGLDGWFINKFPSVTNVETK